MPYVFFADDSLLWFHRGLAYHNLAKFPQALEAYDRAMQLGDENMLASMQMARLMLFKLDRPEDARGSITRNFTSPT